MTPKAQAIKEKIVKLYFMEIKNICASKDTIKEMKSLSQNGRKYLQIVYLIRNLHLEYAKKKKKTQLTKMTNNPTVKWARDLNRHFSNEDTFIPKVT